MTGVEAAVLQYGALGLLALVLVAVAAYLRESSRRADERMSKRDDFLQALFNQVTARLDAVAESQHQTAMTLAELCKSINIHSEKTSVEHAQILECAKRPPARTKAAPRQTA